MQFEFCEQGFVIALHGWIDLEGPIASLSNLSPDSTVITSCFSSRRRLTSRDAKPAFVNKHEPASPVVHQSFRLNRGERN